MDAGVTSRFRGPSVITWKSPFSSLELLFWTIRHFKPDFKKCHAISRGIRTWYIPVRNVATTVPGHIHKHIQTTLSAPLDVFCHGTSTYIIQNNRHSVGDVVNIISTAFTFPGYMTHFELGRTRNRDKIFNFCPLRNQPVHVYLVGKEAWKRLVLVFGGKKNGLVQTGWAQFFCGMHLTLPWLSYTYTTGQTNED